MADENFALRLKELREAAGLSQPELAERAGMNRFGIAKLEQGVREPSWSTVQALCKALKVSCDSFMQPPTDATPRQLGRPAKAKQAESVPKRLRGRPRKAEK